MNQKNTQHLIVTFTVQSASKRTSATQNSGWCATKELARRIWNIRPIEDKLTAFVEKIAKMDELEYNYGNVLAKIKNPLQNEARALLRGESEEAK